MKKKHLQYRDLTSFNVTHFEQINLDHNFLVEHSGTSDNRPFTTSDTSPETTPEKQTSMLNFYTLDNIPNNLNKKTSILFSKIDREPHQEHPLYPPSPQVSDIQQANPSETATTQNTSEFSEETVQNTRSFTITDDSNLIQNPTHNITQHELNNQNQDNTLIANQDNTSVLSTSHTNITQPSQTQVSPRRNYDPPSIPPQFSTQIHTQNSPQPSTSNTQNTTQNTNTVHFQTPTPPSPSEIQTSTYTPAQTNPVHNTQPTSNINTIHSNPSFNCTTSRHLSRPPHYKPPNFKYKILLQQQLEPILTFTTLLPLLLLIFQITLHTIQHHHLPYLTILCHTQHISPLLLLYQNPLNPLMD